MNSEIRLVEYIVSNITDGEDKFEISRSVDERGVLITLFVKKEHLGRVIGRNGSTAQSMRTLLRALGLKNGAYYNLKIEELL